ncbi:MAG: hypothetical protein KAR42_02075 [candidate division Zixibacteria bacterium]|nr:hypothetical protein [candidate division Zixibacteria bacterium]
MYTRPWLKEYKSLVNQIKSTMGGKIKISNLNEPSSHIGSDRVHTMAEEEHYPSYWGELDGYGLRIELESHNTPETLVLSVLIGHDHYIIIRPENLFDSFMKKIKFSSEFLTGKNEFDNTLFIDRLQSSDKPLVSNPNFQDLALKIMPFCELRIRRGQVEMTFEVNDATMLSYDFIESRVVSLVEIAKIIKPK